MAAVEFEYPAGHVVEEVAIVGDRDHGAGKVLEEAFQPGDRFRVEVVGRFVENQHVGVRQQQSAQRDTAFFTARQVFYCRVPRRQAQRVGGDIELAFEIPGARGIDFLLHFGLLRQQVVHFIIGHGLGKLHVDRVEAIQQCLGFGDAEFDIAAHVELHCRVAVPVPGNRS